MVEDALAYLAPADGETAKDMFIGSIQSRHGLGEVILVSMTKMTCKRLTVVTYNAAVRCGSSELITEK